MFEYYACPDIQLDKAESKVLKELTRKHGKAEVQIVEPL